MTDLVYFIGCERARSMKIGFTAGDPMKRLRALQTGSPRQLVFIAAVEAEQKYERLLHETFRPLHIHGEWFRWEGKLRDLAWHFEDAAAGNGKDTGICGHAHLWTAVYDCLITGYYHEGVDEDRLAATADPSVWLPFFQ